MLELNYPAAAIPEPFQILGLRLKPFSLGHYLLMERFQVAFVAAEARVPTIHDLILGVLICSMEYQEFLEFLSSPTFAEELQQWGVKCGLFDWTAKANLLAQYIAAGSKQPVVIYENEGAPSGAHWAQTIKLALTGNLGYTAHEALNLPLSQALNDFYKHAENLGILTIADETTAQLLLAADQEENEVPMRAGEPENETASAEPEPPGEPWLPAWNFARGGAA